MTDPVPGGCHEARTDAIKHQRALYANESRVASMYAELDALPAEVPSVPAAPVVVPAASELVKIEIGKENAALTASMMQQMERMSERQSTNDAALIAALQAIGERDHIVNLEANVSPTPIHVDAPNVTVSPTPINVAAPNVTVESPNVNVSSPDVHVTAEITTPDHERQKKIVFERNLEGRVTGATVNE